MEEIAKFIEKEYDLKNVSIDFTLQEKGGRSVYKITTDKGMFVYKSSNEAKTSEEMEKDMYVFEFAEKNDFENIPRIFKAKNGNNFVKNTGGYVHIMEFIDDGEPIDNARSWKEVGIITAKLHNFQNYKYETSFTPESEKETYKEIAKNLSFGKEYLEIAKNLPDFRNCVKSLIHTDIGLHNTAKNKEGKIFFLDWDSVGIGISILDLGFPLLSQFLDEKLVFKKENALAFYNAYFENRDILEEDKKLIFDAGLFFQLIYLPYGNIEKNWEKINFAIKNKKEVMSVIQV